VLVEDKLFATLGTTVRALHPEVTPRILVSDTVGFIKKLPHDLVASFRSTLDEALEASLLLHVVDASDEDFRSQYETTREVLAEIGADAVPGRIVLNKIDQVPAERARFLQREFPEALLLSAHRPEDVEALRTHIIEYFDGAMETREVFVPYARGALVGEVHAQLEVLSERYDENGVYLTVRATTQSLTRIEGRLAGA
jgi:GTP-binding protein HflX